MTSLELRNNKPDERNGLSSLNILSPSVVDTPIHRRKGSFATFASSHEGHSSLDETEPDHGSNDLTLFPLRRPKSRSHPDKFPSESEVHVKTVNRTLPPPEASSHWSGGGIATEGKDNGDVIDDTGLEDEPVDTGPFAFKPYKLASLLDPKKTWMLSGLWVA